MSASVQGFNISLPSQSGVFSYFPFRNGHPSLGWNASYAGDYATLSGIPYRTTSYEGASVSLSFTGTAAYFCFTIEGGSPYSLTVNGGSVSQTASPSDPACAGYPASILAYADGLPIANHNISLQTAFGGGNFSFYGAVATVGVGKVGSTVTNTTIDDKDSRWVYNGEWAKVSDTPPLSNYEVDSGHAFTCLYAADNTAAINVTNASALSLIGIPAANTAGYTISFDGSETKYNASTWYGVPEQVLFFSGGLDPTRQYELVVTNWDADQPQQLPQGGCVNLDALVLYKGIPPSPSSTSALAPTASTSSPASSSQSSPAAQSQGAPAGAIAGAVIGGVVAVALAVVLFLFLRRRRRQQHAAFLEHGRRLNQSELKTLATPYYDEPGPSGDGALLPSVLPAAAASRPPAGPSPTSIPSTSFSQMREKRPMPSPPARAERMHSSSSVDAGTRAERVPLTAALEEASTADLVQVLNRRLRNEFERENDDSVTEPPSYEHE